jgi:hypothetical protein
LNLVSDLSLKKCDIRVGEFVCGIHLSKLGKGPDQGKAGLKSKN